MSGRLERICLFSFDRTQYYVDRVNTMVTVTMNIIIITNIEETFDLKDDSLDHNL